MLQNAVNFAVPTLIVAAVSYLLGSISFSIIFSRLFGKTDVRALGSGNAGLTNVLRSVGVKAGVCTLIFDFGKGALSVFAGRLIFQYFCQISGMPPYFQQYGAFIAGFACVIGHIYPLYFQFKGGKGVLASAAMLACIDWRFFAVAIFVFLVVFAATRIVSISSILGSVAFPIANLMFTFFSDYSTGHSGYGPVPLSYVWITTLFSVVLGAMLIFKHKENIRRLRSGTEKKFSIKHS